MLVVWGLIMMIGDGWWWFSTVYNGWHWQILWLESTGWLAQSSWSWGKTEHATTACTLAAGKKHHRAFEHWLILMIHELASATCAIKQLLWKTWAWRHCATKRSEDWYGETMRKTSSHIQKGHHNQFISSCKEHAMSLCDLWKHQCNTGVFGRPLANLTCLCLKTQSKAFGILAVWAAQWSFVQLRWVIKDHTGWSHEIPSSLAFM